MSTSTSSPISSPQPGQVIGGWMVLTPPAKYQTSDGHWRSFCFCRCRCGKQRLVAMGNLRKNVSGCGCVRPSSATQKGESRTRLYRAWSGMVRRCTKPSDRSYPRYGGRGITVDPSWVTFSTFRDWARTHGYADNLTLDRVDNERGYTPDNCQWATTSVQARNTRKTRYLSCFGERKSLADWAEDPRCKVALETLRKRVDQLHWEPRAALETPAQKGQFRHTSANHHVTAFGETKTVVEWTEDPRCLVAYQTLLRRLNTRGWFPETAITTPAGPNWTSRADAKKQKA